MKPTVTLARIHPLAASGSIGVDVRMQDTDTDKVPAMEAAERRLEKSIKKGAAALRRSADALKKIDDLLKSRKKTRPGS